MTCTAKAVNAFGFAAAHEYVKVRGGYDDGDDDFDDDRGDDFDDDVVMNLMMIVR